MPKLTSMLCSSQTLFSTISRPVGHLGHSLLASLWPAFTFFSDSGRTSSSSLVLVYLWWLSLLLCNTPCPPLQTKPPHYIVFFPEHSMWFYLHFLNYCFPSVCYPETYSYALSYSAHGNTYSWWKSAILSLSGSTFLLLKRVTTAFINFLVSSNYRQRETDS